MTLFEAFYFGLLVGLSVWALWLQFWRRPLRTVHLVFDDMPDHVPARFIEAEDASGKSVNAGEWRKRTDGLVELVIKVR